MIAHGKVIAAENIAVPDRHYHVFKFKATFDLVPKAMLIVYRFKNDEIVATKTEIPIEDNLNNYVKLKLSSVEVQPGKDVNIDVVTNPKSYVGLVGVDQSVLLLKKNNDLTKEAAMQEMNDYEEHFHETENGPWTVEPRRYINDYWRNFDYSNVILFTNAKQEVYRFVHRVFASSAVYKKGNSNYYSTTPAFAQAAPGFAGAALDSLPEMSMRTSEPIEMPRVRQEFPETWLWETVDVDNTNGTITLNKKVPDTITSWVISAFSLNPNAGLGLTKNPKTLKVFQPFFISLNLPYSVKRGEVVAIPVILFNYLDTDLVADLTLHNPNGDFEFIGENLSEDDQKLQKRQVTVTSNNGVSSTYLVRFNKVGAISVQATAISPMAGDAINRILQVDPEGVPQFVNKAVFVDLRESKEFDAVQNIDVPDKSVEGSLKINVNAIGDLLGGTIQNLHQLIRLPTGCGEQNMLKFVPNVVILDYLTAANTLKPEIQSKAIKYLTRGYQRELTYRHIDGSYSSFGKLDKKGSTWLTGFVAKSFKQADKYIEIDKSAIENALDWLSSIQAADGSFPEVGQISHDVMQGGSSKGIALTAYTAIAFLKNKVSFHFIFCDIISKI